PSMSSFQVFDANAERQSPTFADFTHTFVLYSTTHTEQSLSEIPKALALNVSRKRRVHNKSRKGCENCRRRRVKCNEDDPCENCTRRGDTCIASANLNANGRSYPALSQTLPNSISDNAMVNLHHTKLFHHFESSTHKTLLIDPDVWKKVLQLSFQFEYLMNTILCVAARHLSLLQPDNIEHSATAAQHLCRALSLFQYQLSTNFTSTHIDAFIATTLLLLYEVWSQPDPLASDHSPVSAYESKDNHHVHDISCPIEGGYVPAIGRLCLILAFLPGPGQPQPDPDEGPLLSDLARCIFMFPVSCHGAFASMVQESDPHALLVLYHFYRATRILLCSSEYWWAHGHASRSEKWLKNYLTQLITN
ncbi:unnamed protein product, partial [Clonostachys solani]